MKDFEQLTDEEQTNVIMQIGSKLDKQEMCYWMGLVHLLREQDKRIKKAREYIGKRKFEVSDLEEPPFILNVIEIEELLEILEGNDV